MHRLDGLEALGAAGHVRLVGDHQQQEAAVLEAGQRRRRTGDNFQLGGGRGRIGLAIAHDGAVQDTVAIEKDRARQAQAVTDSHLVSACFSAGCDTSRCQTTAWNASACGVVWPG